MVYMVKLLIMQDSPFSCYFLSLGLNILLCALFSNFINLSASILASEQNSLKGTYKFIVLCI